MVKARRQVIAAGESNAIQNEVVYTYNAKLVLVRIMALLLCFPSDNAQHDLQHR